MAYKKYIKRGGKIYGPYIYHSKRIDGKVVSEYRGTSKVKKINFGFLGKLKFVWIFLGLFVLLGAFYFLTDGAQLTGHSVIGLDVVYIEGEPLKGEVSIFLNEGELIPESSNLVFKSGESVYEYPIKDFISEDLVEGNFFVQDKSVSGLGIGFGVPGNKEVYPELSFVLSVLSMEEVPEEPVEESSALPPQEESEEPAEVPEEPVEESGGNILSNFFLFLVPRLTGSAVVEFEQEVSGIVSRGNDFEYILAEGETVEIKPRSVTLFSSGDQLDDGEVSLVVEGNRVIVSTDYFESEEGFGEEYLGEEQTEIVLDISDLELVLEHGLLEISVDYVGEELLKLTANLEGGEVISGEPPLEDEILNESEEILENEIELNISVVDELPEEKLELTLDERIVLENEFGNLSLEVSEAFSKNGFLTIRYELENYWIEFTYNEDLDNVTLENFMEQDRIKWMKDISRLLSEVEVPEKTEGEYFGSFDILS
jgi:hypothetical protein